MKNLFRQMREYLIEERIYGLWNLYFVALGWLVMGLFLVVVLGFYVWWVIYWPPIILLAVVVGLFVWVVDRLSREP